ncbi:MULTISPECIES: DNA primase [unclassified Mesobacillus]|uniref:DNA primase n=1 Tax=unclassified Mesobacillus TaxID=2675270 RepID=UPI00203F8C6A|nr:MULTISPECIES: DNA primase [unclassified Mesobacillus]MCM3122444.1 DNA primase [Mesobacillus sp. MER 33]MCM3232408.1 DNA primase [Mesobacillus sp. MER 48]
MAERIAEEKVNEIRQAVEIVDVIGDYVQLKKQGRNYFGLCPFHGENSPSFSVSPDKQIYHCFGCGAGGNVFSFLMDIDGLSFQEAAVKLAELANIELKLEGTTASRNPQLPEGSKQMIDAHELLRKFYHHLLVNTKEGQDALEYLLNRGFTEESIDRFQIGYALPSWDFAVKLLEKRGFSPGVMAKAGLVIQRENDGTYFDRFRNRIMFPILDHQGNTIAFSGRAMGDEEPKYLNSPETQIFNKSKILYNFHLARGSIRKQQQAVLFEGFADVISANRAGVENGVATMGTSLTEEHISLLKRNVQAVTLCYDSDKAGIEAAFRASNMLSKAGFAVRVATMPDGMDPDDFIKMHGEEKFRNDIIGSSSTLMAFKLLYYRRGKNLQNEGDRLQYIEEVLKEISKLDKAVEKDLYLRQLANEFSLSLDALIQQLNQLDQASAPRKQNQPRPETRPAAYTRKAELKPAYHTAERRLIFHMMRDADVTYKVQGMLAGSMMNIDEHQAIITYLFAYYEKGHDPDPSAFLNYLQDNKLKRVVADIEMMPLNEEISDQELSDYIKQVLNYQKMLKIKEKMAEQKQAERQNDILRAAAIATEIIQLRKTL